MKFLKKLFGKKDEPEEPVAMFDGEDPGMQAAIKQAQENFPSFKEELALESRRIIPAMEECLIKYAFPAHRDGVKVEHMFLADLYCDGEEVIGILDSRPMHTNRVKKGKKIIVDPGRVTDWLYVVNGQAYGGYTFKYIWQNFSEEEKDVYREQPPFAWLDLE